MYVTVRIIVHRLIGQEQERAGNESKITVPLVIFPVAVIIYSHQAT